MGDTFLLLETAKCFNLLATIKINPKWINRWTSNANDRPGDRLNWKWWLKQIFIASNQTLGYA
jgi:hypothetical protein